MLMNFIINSFSKKVTAENMRKKYGYLGGAVGTTINISLFIIKFIIGILVNSISITADAFNNLSDVGSSIVTIVGFKIADKPADKDHPFGHGRGEYIAGLIISFMVMLVGFEFLKNSFDRILHPSPLKFQTIPFVILLISILAKVWLGFFYKKLAKLISSSSLNATAFDSFSDVIITSCTVASLLISKFIKFPIDGYVGVIVSCFILFAGYNLIKDTISPLLGEAPPAELVENIISSCKSYPQIMGVHDLIIHSYGANKYMASIHVEIPANIPVMESHEIIDTAENEISKKLGILLVIHMDPVNIEDTEIQSTREEIDKILKLHPQILSIHDFRIVGKDSKKNILFDMVISNTLSIKDEKDLLEELTADVQNKYPNYNLVIEVDRNYIGS